MINITAPDSLPSHKKYPTQMNALFLAGSIENGKAELWQEKVVKSFVDNRIIVINPRRHEWNTNASEQFIKSQIKWEQRGLDVSEIVLFYFDPNTISPVSLLELGLIINTDKELVVVCPKEYFRYTNVEQTLLHHGRNPPLLTLEEGIEQVRKINEQLNTNTNRKENSFSSRLSTYKHYVRMLYGKLCLWR